MTHSLITGFVSSLSLIVAIGAQNAFVLRQGLRREHVLAVCLVCAGSDALLISAGVFGLGALVDAMPNFDAVMRLGGAAFLVMYGLRSLYRARRPGQGLDTSSRPDPGALAPVIATCLALTWLNPHVYLDTVVLLGSIAADAPSPLLFCVGACTASFVFFFTLGFGARFLAPVVARPNTWRVLDALVGVTMLAIAWVLLAG